MAPLKSGGKRAGKAGSRPKSKKQVREELGCKIESAELLDELRFPARLDPDTENIKQAATGAKLPPALQELVAARLGEFRTYQEIVDILWKDYGIKISIPAIMHYRDRIRSPRSPNSERLKAVYEAFRRRYLEAVDEHAVSHLAYRSEIYTRAVNAAMSKQATNWPLVLQTLEQAAKDAGGAYTSKREISGPNGGPVLPPGAVVINVSEMLAGVRSGLGAAAIPAGDEDDPDA